MYSTLAVFLISCNQSTHNRLSYIDEKKPSIEPRIFAKDFISRDSISEFGSIFNQKGTEFYYAVDSEGKSAIKYTKIINGQWIEPITIISHTKYSFNDPFLSPKEAKLYYISDKLRNEQDTINDYDIWYSNRVGQKWSEPINAGMEINSDADEYYISFNSKGAMYFASNKNKEVDRKHDFDIYKSKYISEKFQSPQKLSDSINTKGYEADVYISPDESYIIYCSARKSGFGKGDLYINFRGENGKWTNSINMGKSINSEEHELCPFVTKDGKFLFYTSNKDIYWVSTDIIDAIKEKSR